MQTLAVAVINDVVHNLCKIKQFRGLQVGTYKGNVERALGSERHKLSELDYPGIQVTGCTLVKHQNRWFMYYQCNPLQKLHDGGKNSASFILFFNIISGSKTN